MAVVTMSALPKAPSEISAIAVGEIFQDFSSLAQQHISPVTGPNSKITDRGV